MARGPREGRDANATQALKENTFALMCFPQERNAVLNEDQSKDLSRTQGSTKRENLTHSGKDLTLNGTSELLANKRKMG